MNTIKNVSKTTEPKPGGKPKQTVYTLFLGNGNMVKFTNKRMAKDFEVLVLRSINEFIRTSNIIYAEIVTQYRRLWPAMEPRKSVKITELVNDISILFDKVYLDMGLNSFTNVWLIYSKLSLCIEQIERFVRLKRNYIELYSLITQKSGLDGAALKIKILKSKI